MLSFSILLSLELRKGQPDSLELSGYQGTRYVFPFYRSNITNIIMTLNICIDADNNEPILVMNLNTIALNVHILEDRGGD